MPPDSSSEGIDLLKHLMSILGYFATAFCMDG